MQSLAGLAATGFAIADTHRPPRITVEQAVVGTKVQIRLVEQQADRDAPDLAALSLAQLLVEGMQQPAVPPLHLRGDGELIVLLRQTLAVLLDDLADGNPTEYPRGDSKAYEHDGSP